MQCMLLRPSALDNMYSVKQLMKLYFETGFSDREKTVEINICLEEKTEKLEAAAAVHNDIDGNGQTHKCSWLSLRVLQQGSVLIRCLVKSVGSQSAEHQRVRLH